jgi:hypothetical protein
MGVPRGPGTGGIPPTEEGKGGAVPPFRRPCVGKNAYFLLAVDFFLAVDFLAVDFFAVDFFAVDFLAVDFFAVDFFLVAAPFLAAVDLFAADFALVAAPFLAAVDLFAADYALVAAPFLAAVDLFAAVDFLAVDFLATGMDSPPSRSSSGRHTLQASPFPLAHPAPYAVPLVATQGVVEALDADGTLGADALRLAGGTSLLGEEDLRVEVSTARPVLPRYEMMHGLSPKLHSCNSEGEPTQMASPISLHFCRRPDSSYQQESLRTLPRNTRGESQFFVRQAALRK